MVWSRVLRVRLSSAAGTELCQDESAGVVHGRAAEYAVRPVEASFALDPTQRVGAVHRRGTGCGPGGVFGVERGAEVAWDQRCDILQVTSAMAGWRSTTRAAQTREQRWSFGLEPRRLLHDGIQGGAGGRGRTGNPCGTGF